MPILILFSVEVACFENMVSLLHDGLRHFRGAVTQSHIGVQGNCVRNHSQAARSSRKRSL